MKDYVIMFDLDGTLINTNTLIKKSFIHTFHVHKPSLVLSDEVLLSFLGPTLEDTFLKYFKEDEVEEVVNTYRTYNKANHDDYVTIFDGVVETLDFFKSHQFPMAIITSKRNDVAKMGLDMFGLGKYFEMIVAYEDVEKAKPDPEGVYKVLNHFHCSRGVMVGDNPSDLLAGIRANIDSAGVAWSSKGEQALQEYNPSIVVQTMSELISFVGGKTDEL